MRLVFDPERAIPLAVYAALERRGMIYLDGVEVLCTEAGAKYAADLRGMNGTEVEFEHDEALLAAAVWQMSKEAFGSPDAALESLLATTGPDSGGRYPPWSPRWDELKHRKIDASSLPPVGQ